MRVRIKRKNLRRLASLSALGAGAMAATVGTAEADVVVNVNQSVGFDTGFSSGPVKVSLPGGAGFSLVAASVNPLDGFTTLSRKDIYRGRFPNGQPSYSVLVQLRHVEAFNPNVGLATHGVHLSRFLGPQTLATAFSSAGRPRPGGPQAVALQPGEAAVLASRILLRTVTQWCSDTIIGRFDCARLGLRTGNLISSNHLNNFPNPYRDFHFSFQDNGQTLYGWGQVSVTVGPGVGPDVTLLDYAYETPTAPPPPVPEPSETVPLALSALVLGAAGIRRWRAAKTS